MGKSSVWSRRSKIPTSCAGSQLSRRIKWSLKAPDHAFAPLVGITLDSRLAAVICARAKATLSGGGFRGKQDKYGGPCIRLFEPKSAGHKLTKNRS